LFSLGVLTVMIGLAMRMVGAVTAAFVAKYYASMALTGAAATDGINSMALQQGGMGLVLSTLIVMAPPIAASFFQGTLAQFSAYSAFGNIGARQAGGSQPPGTPGYQPAPIGRDSANTGTNRDNVQPTFAQQNATAALPNLNQVHKDEIRRT
jgi:type IV secretion system protein VirB6